MPISEYYRDLRERIGNRLLIIPGVAAVIHNSEGELLLQLPAQETSGERWSLPAGAIEPGERPEETVVREVREETGLIVGGLHLLGVDSGAHLRYTYPNGHKVESLILYFACTIIGGDLTALDGESAKLRYFNLQQLPNLVLPYPPAILRGEQWFFTSDRNSVASD